MNGNKKIQLLGALFFISLLIACGAIMYAADNFGSDVGMTKWDKIYELSSGWYYETDEGRQTIASLPAEIDAGDEETDTLAMFCRLPELISENSVLQLNGNHMALEVFVDEKRVYEHGIDQNAPVGKILGNPWLLIDLPDDAAGRELSIRFTSPYGKGHFHVPEISFGDKADVLRQFLYDNIQTIALCMTAFIFATLILMLVAFFAIKNSGRPKLIDISGSLYIFGGHMDYNRFQRAASVVPKLCGYIYSFSYILYDDAGAAYAFLASNHHVRRKNLRKIGSSLYDKCHGSHRVILLWGSGTGKNPNFYALAYGNRCSRMRNPFDQRETDVPCKKHQCAAVRSFYSGIRTHIVLGKLFPEAAERQFLLP